MLSSSYWGLISGVEKGLELYLGLLSRFWKEDDIVVNVFHQKTKILSARLACVLKATCDRTGFFLWNLLR